MDVKSGDIFDECHHGRVEFYQVVELKGGFVVVKEIHKHYLWFNDGFPREGEVIPRKGDFKYPGKKGALRKIKVDDYEGKPLYSIRTILGGRALLWDGKPVKTWGF